MSLRLTYLIGEPGAGKSTLFAALTADWSPTEQKWPGITVTEWATPDGTVCELGRRRPDYPGTDALSLSAGPKALQILASAHYRTVIAEGDRLAYPGFFDTAQQYGYTLDLVVLTCPPDLAAQRRDERGSNQQPAWLDSRRTKVANLAARYPHRTLDATQPPATLAHQLWHDYRTQP